MQGYEWTAREKCCHKKSLLADTAPIFHHPLKSFTFGSIGLGDSPGTFTTTKETKNSSTSGSVASLTKSDDASGKPAKPKFIDPLGVTFENTAINGTADDFIDSIKNKNEVKVEKIKNTLLLDETIDVLQEFDPKIESFECWSMKKISALKKFTTNEKLSIVTSFLPGGVPLHSQVAVSDVKLRLEQLDLFQNNSVRRIQNLSQKEYVDKINELTKALIKAWGEDQRVQAIKIVIQCAKFLSDTATVPRFYPSQFFLVIDVLDTFGRLVFDRLKQKVIAENSDLQSKYDAKHIPEATKEIARNWFYKIASIRELLPRFYIEAALACIYRFIDFNELAGHVTRLAEACRGIGDPMASIYARCYLTKVAMNIEPSSKTHAWRCFHDSLTLIDRNYASMSSGECRDLFEPALSWIIQCLCYRISRQDVDAIVECCKQKRSLLLNYCVLRALPAKFVSENAVDWLKILKTSTTINDTDDSVWVSKVLRRLGTALAIEPPSPDESLRLLKEAWKILRRFDVQNYAPCAVSWLQFACQNFGSREINALIDDLTRVLTPDKKYENFYAELSEILINILRNMVPKFGFTVILSMDKFQAFMDMFQRNDVKVEAAKNVLIWFCKYTQPFECDDPTMTNYAISYCRVLHDNLNALSSSDDEKRQISSMICKTLGRFTFGDDYERQLTFYVDARTYFFELDAVTARLVHLVNALIMRLKAETYSRRSTRKMAEFVRACIAFVFVTIPTVSDHFVRLRLYLTSISVALSHNCQAQADGLVLASLDVLSELPSIRKISENRTVSNEPEVIECMQHFLSHLLIIPDSPGGDPLSYFSAFLNVVFHYPWSENGDSGALVWLKCLIFLSWASQSEYPYHVDGCESNDSLYGGHEAFLVTCRKKGAEIIDLLLTRLKFLGQKQQFRRRSILCLDFFEILLHYADLSTNNGQLLALAVNLWTLARKDGQQDEKRCSNLLRYIKKCSSEENFDDKETWSRLLKSMQN